MISKTDDYRRLTPHEIKAMVMFPGDGAQFSFTYSADLLHCITELHKMIAGTVSACRRSRNDLMTPMMIIIITVQHCHLQLLSHGEDILHGFDCFPNQILGLRHWEPDNGVRG